MSLPDSNKVKSGSKRAGAADKKNKKDQEDGVAKKCDPDTCTEDSGVLLVQFAILAGFVVLDVAKNLMQKTTTSGTCVHGESILMGAMFGTSLFSILYSMATQGVNEGIKECFSLPDMWANLPSATFFAFSQAFNILTLQQLPSGIAKVMAQIRLPMMVVLSQFFFKRYFNTKQWLTVGVLLMGVCVFTAISKGTGGGTGEENLPLGAFFCILGSLSTVLGTLFNEQTMKKDKKKSYFVQKFHVDFITLGWHFVLLIVLPTIIGPAADKLNHDPLQTQTRKQNILVRRAEWQVIDKLPDKPLADLKKRLNIFNENFVGQTERDHNDWLKKARLLPAGVDSEEALGADDPATFKFSSYKERLEKLYGNASPLRGGLFGEAAQKVPLTEDEFKHVGQNHPTTQLHELVATLQKAEKALREPAFSTKITFENWDDYTNNVSVSGAGLAAAGTYRRVGSGPSGAPKNVFILPPVSQKEYTEEHLTWADKESSTPDDKEINKVTIDGRKENDIRPIYAFVKSDANKWMLIRLKSRYDQKILKDKAHVGDAQIDTQPEYDAKKNQAIKEYSDEVQNFVDNVKMGPPGSLQPLGDFIFNAGNENNDANIFYTKMLIEKDGKALDEDSPTKTTYDSLEQLKGNFDAVAANGVLHEAFVTAKVPRPTNKRTKEELPWLPSTWISVFPGHAAPGLPAGKGTILDEHNREHAKAVKWYNDNFLRAWGEPVEITGLKQAHVKNLFGGWSWMVFLCVSLTVVQMLFAGFVVKALSGVWKAVGQALCVPTTYFAEKLLLANPADTWVDKLLGLSMSMMIIVLAAFLFAIMKLEAKDDKEKVEMADVSKPTIKEEARPLLDDDMVDLEKGEGGTARYEIDGNLAAGGENMAFIKPR